MNLTWGQLVATVLVGDFLSLRVHLSQVLPGRVQARTDAPAFAGYAGVGETPSEAMAALRHAIESGLMARELARRCTAS